jgi:Domain of unknown function (DUF4838)/Carbohydrate family 9 binding domain-like
MRFFPAANTTQALCAMVVLAVLAGALRSALAGELTVVADGRSPYVIAYAEGVDKERIAAAAEFLRGTIKESTGVGLRVVKEAEVPRGTPAIYLGRSKAAKRAGLAVDEIRDWGYLNCVRGRDIFLVGEDRKSKIAPGPRPRTAGVHGSFKAVTAFLDDQMGVRFLMPGKYGTHVPKSDRFVVDAQMNVRWTPIFKYVGGRMANYYNRHKKSLRDTAFGFANHMFGQSEFLYDYGGHSYYYAVPAKKYWKAHPEYFAEVGGIRSPKDNHLCIANLDVQELMLKEMERQLDRGFQWVELEQSDGYIPCECKACKAIHPDSNERVWIVHRKLAVEVLKRRPGKTVMLTSYGPTRMPPTSFKMFPANVALRLTRYRPRDFEMWEEWGAKSVPKSLYTTNWLTVHPQVSPWVAVQQNRLFVKHNIKGMYLCGGITENSKGNWYPWGLGGPGYYAFFKSLHDPEVDPVAMRAEYVGVAFGKAAAPMQNFFAALDERMDQFWWLFRADPYNSPSSRLAGKGGAFSVMFYPPSMLRELDTSLARAQEQALDERVKARLKLVALEYEYLKAHALVHHFYRTYRLAPSKVTLDMLKRRVDAFYRTRTRIWPDGKATKIDGLPSPFAGIVYKVHRSVAKGPPFNWDFDLLRKKGVLPGVGMKRTEARRIKRVKLDGRLDDRAWQGIPFVEIGEIAMGKAPSETHFKVAYDKANLYVAFRGGLTSPTVLDGLKPVGRDGTAWRQENMELVVDPLGTRRMYYHFIINPVPKSTLDRRFGYHQEPDHPLYQKFEWNWNGDWAYVAHIDKAKAQWAAEMRIPFKTLQVDPPGAGDVWTMNVGRTQYPEGSGNSRKAACYLWSPNLQSRTFHDMSTFGELIFR